MSDQNIARELRTPSHGVGQLLTPYRPGQSGNPGGRPRMREVRALCRDRSLKSAQVLCDIAEDPAEDGRVRVVAAQQVLTWAYGKPPDYDPREDKPPLALNTAILSPAERTMLLALLRRGLVTEAEPEQEVGPGLIDGEAAK